MIEDTIATTTAKGFTKAIMDFFLTYKGYLIGIVAILIMVNITMIILMLARLPKTGSNPQERRFIINELVALFFCLAILGSIPIIFAVFFNLFN